MILSTLSVDSTLAVPGDVLRDDTGDRCTAAYGVSRLSNILGSNSFPPAIKESAGFAIPVTELAVEGVTALIVSRASNSLPSFSPLCPSQGKQANHADILDVFRTE